jgi:Na+/pantothenate symporter
VIVKLIAAIIIADCIALILYFYDTIRLDFYYILSGFVVAAISFAAGWHEAKKE